MDYVVRSDVVYFINNVNYASRFFVFLKYLATYFPPAQITINLDR